MSYFSQISYADTPNIDAFGRLRISTSDTIWNVQSQYNANSIKMEAGATGTGVAPTHNSNTRLVILSCGAGTGTSFLQSFRYIPYQPGKSHFIKITGVFGAPVAGATMDYLYGDLLNAIFYRQNGVSGVQIGSRTATSGAAIDTLINQASWNIDTFGASALNPSGITLDTTKDFVLVIDLQYLGMGRVRVGFDIKGIIYYAHQFLSANVLTLPYMQSATLPIQILLTATATAGASNTFFKCASVDSEAGISTLQGYEFSTPEATITAASGARTHILSIRPKATFNGIVNREFFEFNNLNVFVTGANPVFWELCIGITFSVNPTYADVNTSFSGFEYGINGTFLNLTTGIVLSSGYINGTTNQAQSVPIAEQLKQLYDISLDRAGVTRALGTLSLLVTGIGGGSATRASINYLESR